MRKIILTVCLLAASHSMATEQITSESRLTPVGAERSANADGTIPEWTGGLQLNAEQDYSDGRPQGNPFSAEIPYLTITASTADRHVEKLSLGQLALLKTYPESYKINVYPTHRTFANSPEVYQAAQANRENARLQDNGNGVVGYSKAYPFPELTGSNAEQAVQVMWNHMLRWRSGAFKRNIVQVTPTQSGQFIPVKLSERFAFRDSLADSREFLKSDIYLFFKQEVSSPVNMAGNILLVHETVNQVKDPRRAWFYQRDQRRVKRSPTVAYDSPGTAADGLRTNDNFDMFNGAPDKYQWQLLGKREVYIPYNNLELTSPEHRYRDIIGVRHVNPELLRYELHRVWVVEAKLKANEDHIYQKRIFYVDEDSWQIALIDHYNAAGELWRVSEGYHFQHPQEQVSMLAAQAIYDLLSGRYLVNGLTNEESVAFEWQVASASQDFMPAALRREGH